MGALLAAWMVLALGGLAFGADLDRGVELYKEGKYAEASATLRAVVEEEPENGRAHRYLGLALLGEEKLPEAARHLEKAGELDPGGETKLALARLYLEQKEFGKADAVLGEAEGEDLEYVRGQVHLNQKRYDQAARDLDAYIKKNPEEAYAHYYAGLAYNGLRRPDRMLTHFELFLKLKPDAPEARKVRSVMKTAR
jgi:tetratricopeptide (TPR) repeat protein